jgi:phage-related protein
MYSSTDILPMDEVLREIVWMGPTKKELGKAPGSVQRAMAGALRTAQQGGKSDDAVPMQGDLRDVMEVRDRDESGIYRLMYTVKIGEDIIVLDYFQKKGASGGATRNEDIDRIKKRLKRAREQYATSKR